MTTARIIKSRNQFGINIKFTDGVGLRFSNSYNTFRVSAPTIGQMLKVFEIAERVGDTPFSATAGSEPPASKIERYKRAAESSENFEQFVDYLNLERRGSTYTHKNHFLRGAIR